MLKHLLSILFLVFSIGLFAQEEAPEAESEMELEPKNRLAIVTINSHVPAEEADGRAIIPAWGIEYERRFNENWAVMVNFEVELVTYFVDFKDEVALEREYPFVASIMVVRRLTEDIILSAGYGREFESHENFDLLTFNATYEIRLPNYFDIAPGLTYNTRFDAFDTFSFNIGFGKSF